MYYISMELIIKENKKSHPLTTAHEPILVPYMCIPSGFSLQDQKFVFFCFVFYLIYLFVNLSLRAPLAAISSKFRSKNPILF